MSSVIITIRFGFFWSLFEFDWEKEKVQDSSTKKKVNLYIMGCGLLFLMILISLNIKFTISGCCSAKLRC